MRSATCASKGLTGFSWVYGGRSGSGLNGLSGGGISATRTGTQAYALQVAGIVIPVQFVANGNQTRALEDGVVKGWDYDGDDRSTAVWKGSSSENASRRTRFENGAGGDRVRRIDDGFGYGMARTTQYLGSVERIEQGGAITWRRTIAGIAVQTFAGASPILNHTRYLWQDLLGSQVAVTDAGGSIVERSHFSAYGQRMGGQAFGQGIQTTERGFTNHEQIDDLETTHMNARVYDPTAGRFLQPDPMVQDVYRPQNWNPYAYAFNNPLRYTDPTGMFNIGRFLQMAGYAARIVGILVPGLQPMMAVIGQYLNYASIAYGFSQGGTGGRIGAAFSMLAGGGDTSSFGGFTRGLIVGGVTNRIAGGSFRDGVQGALKSMAINAAISSFGRAYASRETGGKQMNGADTGTQKAAVNGWSGTRDDAAPHAGQTVGDFEGAPDAIRALLRDPTTRERGLRMMAQGMANTSLIPSDAIVYRDVDGPTSIFGRASAQFDSRTGNITVYRNAFANGNYPLVQSMLDHETAHWMTSRFGGRGRESIDYNELDAYNYQISRPAFSQLPQHNQQGIIYARNIFVNNVGRQHGTPCLDQTCP